MCTFSLLSVSLLLLASVHAVPEIDLSQSGLEGFFTTERVGLYLLLGEANSDIPTEEHGVCLALYDTVQKTVRIKGLVDDDSVEPEYVRIPEGTIQASGSPFPYPSPVGHMTRIVPGEFPAAGKAVSLIQGYNPTGGSPVPSISIANAGDDEHGRPTPLLKVKMGEAGTGFSCAMHHDVTLPTYCNGKLMDGTTLENAEVSQTAGTPIITDGDITSIIDNNQIRTAARGGSLLVARADGSLTYGIFPLPTGWLIWQTNNNNAPAPGVARYRIFKRYDTVQYRKKRFLEAAEQIGVYASIQALVKPEYEVALGMCSIDANPEIGGGAGTGMVGPDRFRAENVEQLLELYRMDDDGDATGATYARESITTPADDSEVDDPEDDLGSGSEAGGHCPLVTAEVERNFKKTCKVNAKVEKMCGIFTSSAGPLKDCLASTAGTPTMFNAAAAYEDCRLSICAKVPAKKLCHVIKQHVDLCNKQHVEGGNSHSSNSLWRSATNCKFDKLKKKGDPNGVVTCIDPRERPSCWKPDGCNRLPDIDDSPHECDERMVCNDGYLWNGKKCVKSGSC